MQRDSPFFANMPDLKQGQIRKELALPSARNLTDVNAASQNQFPFSLKMFLVTLSANLMCAFRNIKN